MLGEGMTSRKVQTVSRKVQTVSRKVQTVQGRQQREEKTKARSSASLNTAPNGDKCRMMVERKGVMGCG